MPNRIIKESAFMSDKIAQLTDFEFRLWVGLITQADDAGRGDARPAIIKGRIFALRERTPLKDIENALHALAAHGCVNLYLVGGKPYYEFPNWKLHQRVRNAIPKYPGSDEADASPQVAASRRESPQSAAQSNPIQSNPNPIQSNPREYTRFAPPTREEAEKYCKEKGYSLNLDTWFAYYQQNGWMVGRGKMKDWKASLAYWQSKEKKPTMATPGKATHRETTSADLEHMRKVAEWLSKEGSA